MLESSAVTTTSVSDWSAPASESAAMDYALATVCVVLVVASCMAASAPCRHWFVVPVAICGVLTGSDVVAWLRQRVDTFDPKGIVGAIWFHGTFVAPLLHVSLEAHSRFFHSQVLDWPGWFGRMAMLTAAGLVLYKLSQSYFFHCSSSARTSRRLSDGTFALLLTLAIAICAVAAGVIFVKFGALHKESDARLGGAATLIHLSWLLMLGDALPMLVAVLVIRFLSMPDRSRSVATVGMLLIALLVFQFLMLGFRGSRSAIIFALFLVAALCHYRLRRIGITWVLVSVFSLGIGGYYYKFFKRFGTSGLAAVRSADEHWLLSRRSDITPLNAFLGDLSRAEIQTFELYRLLEHGDEYKLRWGRTYLSAVLTFIPRAVWPTKPTEEYGKVAAGTDLQHGEGTFLLGARDSSRVYGLAGEAMLNFGAAGVPVAYLVYGSLLGWYRRKLTTMHPDDDRFYLVPLFTLVACLGAFGDANNTIFYFLKTGTVLIAIVLLSSTKVALDRMDMH